jgi:hypothetical protein
VRRQPVRDWLSAQAPPFRRAVVRRGGRSVRLARPLAPLRREVLRSVRQRPEALSVSHRDAAAARLCFRWAEAWSLAMPLAQPVWRQARVAAWRRRPVAAQAKASPSGMKAAVASVSGQQVASALQALLPAAEEAVSSDVQVPPREVAEVLPAPWGRRPREVSGAQVQPQAAAGPASDVVVGPPRAVAAEAWDAAAALPQGAVAEARPDAEVPQPAAAERRARAPSVRRLAAAPPSAAAGLPAGRPWVGRRLPWLAPRRSARPAHAMRRSRTASPSKQSWRAAECGGLS